jgi:hypothetical protein
MRYTDGFVAWINGQQVASVNAPTPLDWNSAATAIHSPERYYTTTITVTSGMLIPGKNILAIQGLNYSASDGNFLILPQLDCVGGGVYFVTPTPGAVNSLGKTDIGPFVSDVTNQVAQPTGGASSQPLTITTTVNPSLRAISTVQIAYRVMFNSETLVTMYDNGTNGDTTSGDHIYTGLIPTTSLSVGQMLRWRVIATDTLGAQTTGPAFDDPTGSEQYYGTVAVDSISTQLPMVQFFVQSYVAGDQTTVDTDAGARGDLYFNGELYDNVLIRIKGMGSRYLYKRSHHVDFNSDHKFLWEVGQPRIGNAAFNDEYVDPSYARQFLSLWLQSVSGTGASPDFPVRLQMNGDFWQLAFFNIPMDSSLLTVMGLDPNGAMYKFCGQILPGSAGDTWIEKRTREWEDDSDYNALATAINASQPAAQRAAAVLDMLDVPQVINYIAMARITMECDDVWANMTLYRDSDGDGLWRIIPCDLNLSFGQMYAGENAANSGIHVNDDNSKAHPLYGGSEYKVFYNNSFYNYNQIYDAIISNPTTRDMLLRRMRSLMDEYLQPPGTPYADRTIENMLDDLAAKCTQEANLDRAKWGWPVGAAPYGMGTPSFAQAISDIKTQYLDPRRTHMYVDHSLNINFPEYAGIPPAQQAGLAINFGSYDANPISGNQEEEYLTLVNPNSVAVDISGWKLSGGIDFTFKSGTVIPAGGTLYVSPNVVAFKQRATGPTGGQGLYVLGGYNGRLSLWGENIQLLNQTNDVVNTLTTTANPSLAQQYLRITELMYHPADPPTGSAYVNEDFEFVELKNTSATQTLDLTGVRFTNGPIYDFTGSSVTSLAPGAKVLVVSNLSAFQSRYGTSLNSIIAGQYGVVTSMNLDPKHLSNSGEKVTLVDALGETILSFTYADTWYKQTDGSGNSLVIRNASTADRTLWDQSEGWAASQAANGSPGADETPVYAADAIVVNELLAHRTDEQGSMGDWVEFHNTTGASIDIGNWYLSNDDKNLKKYQIPAGTIISAYGYKAFNWRDNFGSTANPGCITPFTLGEMGGTVYLTSAASGVLTGFETSEDFSSSDTGVTLGRYIKSTGGKDFVAMATPTYEAPNSQPLVGPVVINEIYYHPDTGGNAFIELKNITSREVKLYDPALPKNTWHLTEGVDFTFPVGATIPANGYALIVECNPAYFRTKYNIPSAVPIYGPYINILDKSGDTIELKYPDDPQPDGDVPYDRMDQITYEDSGLWPNSADGAGASLNRISATAYGNDAANWAAGYPTPGADYAAFNFNPITLVTPAGASFGTITGNTTNLSVVANDIQGEANVIYDWSVTALPIGVTYPTFSVNDTNAAKNTTATFYKAGNYTLTVTLADVYGGVITSSVNVTVVQTQTSVGIVPASVMLSPGASQQFTTARIDQFGNVMGPLGSSVAWSATAGTITSNGFYTAPASGTATITATSGATNLTATVQVVSPVVYWKLDGNGNDSSGNNQSLTLVNSPTYVTGQVGSCLSFNGSSQYANSTGSLVNTSQPFSVSAWVNWNGDGGWNTMISEDGASNSTFFFQKRSGGSFSLTGDNGTGTEAIAMWSTTPTANTWYRLVGVYTGSLLKLYVNGALVASTSFNVVGAPTGNVIVGAAKYGGGRVDYFHGMIDEVMLYNVALSDATVAAMSNSPPTDIALSAAVVAENQSSETTIGTFTTTDPDAGNTFTYTLVDGDGSSDNASFTIDAGGILKTAAPLDYETKSSRNIRVRSVDQSGGWTEKAFTINVTDMPEIFSAGQGVWTTGGLTLTLGADAKLHLYQTNTTTDVVPPHNPSYVTGVSITGRDNTDILINNYSGAYNTLSINYVTFKIIQDNALSASTAVTVVDGTLDLNGKTDTIADLLLKSGSVINGTLHANTYNIESGVVTAAITGQGNLQKTTSASATMGNVSTSNVSVDAGQLTVTSIHTDTLTLGPGTTLTLAPIAGGPLAANIALTPLATRALRPTSRKPILQPTTTDTITPSTSTDVTAVAAELLADSAVLATPAPASSEVASVLASSSSSLSDSNALTSGPSPDQPTMLHTVPVDVRREEVLLEPLIVLLEPLNTVLDVAVTPTAIVANTALPVRLVESASVRQIDTAINRLPSQSPIYSRLDPIVWHKIIEDELEQSLTTNNRNVTSNSILDSLGDELPSHVSKFAKHPGTTSINSRQAHIVALQTVVQKSHWTDTEAEADFDIAQQVHTRKHSKQLENAIDEVLAEEEDAFLVEQ